MKIYERILNEFFSYNSVIETSENIELSENIEQFIIKAKFNKITSFNKYSFEKTLDKIPVRDRIRVYIKQEDETMVSFSSDDDINDFSNEISKLSNDETEEYELNIKISKSFENREVSLYCIDRFAEYLNSLPFRGLLNKFSTLINENYIIFRSIDEIVEFSSNTIYFSSSDVQIENENYELRNKEIRKMREVSNWISSSKINIIPSDFNFKNIDNDILIKLFYKMKCVLSVMGISDIVNIKDSNSIDIIINGYKRFEYNVDFENFDSESIKQYFDVYSWIYNEGNYIDKMGIARNIISLSIIEKDILNLSSDLMPSIESAHNIYLKENIKEYLEVKSKVMDFLFDLNTKCSDLSNNVGKALVTNAFAFITIFITTFIYNIAKEKDFNDIFTKEVTYLSIAMLIGSIGYLIFSIFEVKQDFNRYKDVYSRVRKSYDDILDEIDIKKIFKDDSYIKEDEEYIKKRSKIYIFIWTGLVIFMGIFIFFLGNEHIKLVATNIYQYILRFITWII